MVSLRGRQALKDTKVGLLVKPRVNHAQSMRKVQRTYRGEELYQVKQGQQGQVARAIPGQHLCHDISSS